MNPIHEMISLSPLTFPMASLSDQISLSRVYKRKKVSFNVCRNKVRTMPTQNTCLSIFDLHIDLTNVIDSPDWFPVAIQEQINF